MDDSSTPRQMVKYVMTLNQMGGRLDASFKTRW